MKIISIILFALLFNFSVIAQESKSTTKTFNFDFEELDKMKPSGWTNFGDSNYEIATDSIVKQNGKRSAFLSYQGNSPDFNAFAFDLPENYEGKKITLTGYVKTENVTEGYAGLWMRIDPEVGFNNMMDRGLKGNNDWTKCSVELDMNPSKTKKIVLGGLLVGKGKMWLDNLQLTIDGKDIALAKIAKAKVYKAELDHAFDDGSKIIDIQLNEKNTESLYQLGLIWGFLKYYHPAIAKGNYNWDYELFRTMPKILDTKNDSLRAKVYVDWIKQLGKVNRRKEEKKADIFFGPDLAWIETSSFPKELNEALLRIKNAERPGEHYYMDFVRFVGNPEIKNENGFDKMIYPDTGFRLLALYRYWNLIQYFFPYKNLIEEDWKKVMKEFIPKVIRAQNETEYATVMLELIGRIHDTHANIWGSNKILTKYFGENFAAPELKIIENKVVVTGFYHDSLGKESGLQKGDIITHINGKRVEEIIAERMPLTPASNKATKHRDIAKNLLRSNGNSISISYVRNSSSSNIELKTLPAGNMKLYGRDEADTSFKMIRNDIGYIHNGQLKRSELPEIWKKVKDSKGLILDLRNYPSDFPIYSLCEYLMPNAIPFAKFSATTFDFPGEFIKGPAFVVGKKNNAEGYKGRIIILINEISQSSSEFHALAYRVHPNATVLGSTTAGADGNVSSFRLPGSIRTMISGIGVYYPDGKETQRVGIVPDIEMTPTIKGILEGRDELLEKAIELINQP